MHAPLKNLSRRQKKLQTIPWLTKGILISIRRKRRLYKIYFLEGNQEQKRFYKKYQNKLIKVKHLAKKFFYEEQFTLNKGNPRKTWDLINSALTATKQKRKKSAIDRLVLDNKVISDSNGITETFNRHFASIGKKLASQVSSPNSCKNFLKSKILSSIFLEPPRYNEVYNLIHSVGLRRAAGSDGIDSYFIRISCDVITPYITQLYSLSFDFGIYPECLKTAKIIPIFKAGLKTEVNNYRPIFLSNFSKILEKLIYSRLTKFLEKHKILHDNQYGFRENLSTTHAMLDIMNKISCNIKNKKITGLIFLDLKKAFDTVSHDILLLKLDHYGIRGNAYTLLKTYLTGRKQFVSVNEAISSTADIEYGVPQGSNLGSILFSIYVNDFFNTYDSAPVLYADDTCIKVEAETTNDLELLLNQAIEKASNWMKANKLTINAAKSNIMIINSTTKNETQYLDVRHEGQLIERTQNVKYLGLRIDDKLKFNVHIKNIERKIACAVGILYKLSSFFPTEVLLQLYHALIYPHLLYAIPIWGSTYNTYLHKIVALQNKGVKLISRVKWETSAIPYYETLDILKLDELYNFEVTKIMYHIYHKAHPPNLTRDFIKVNQRHSLVMRRSNSRMFTTPLLKTTRLQQSFLFQGVKVWNSIPQDIKKCSFRKFKSNYKKFLLNKV